MNRPVDSNQTLRFCRTSREAFGEDAIFEDENKLSKPLPWVLAVLISFFLGLNFQATLPPPAQPILEKKDSLGSGSPRSNLSTSEACRSIDSPGPR